MNDNHETDSYELDHEDTATPVEASEEYPTTLFHVLRAPLNLHDTWSLN
jgi:hypothetical protein